MKQLYFLILVCGSLPLVGQQLRVGPAEYGFDVDRGLLLVRYGITQPERPLTSVRAGTLEFELLQPLVEVLFGTSYAATTQTGDTVALWFTRLPLIKLVTPVTINRDTKVAAEFSYADDSQVLTSAIGIRHRGSFSTHFPKRSFDLEFWVDADERKTQDVSFGGLREDDDWVLDALYNEPMRVNSYVAHKVWLDLHVPYYQDREEKARAGADVQLVEAFYDDSYYGVYLLSEQVDRKQLQLRKFRDGEIGGELYKGAQWTGATRLAARPALPTQRQDAYAGWEVKYPDATDVIDWTRLYDLLGFTSKASDEGFAAEVADHFVLDNIIDYFLFVNAAGLIDNTGKNTYLARYQQGEPYFYVPWDLDVSFGNTYDGKRMTDTEFWATNHLLNRLIDLDPGDFTARLCDRYRVLRSTLLTTEVLQDRLDQAYRYLLNNGVYAREQARWRNARYDQNQVDFTQGFIRDRMAYLDTYVCGLSTSAQPVAMSPIGVYPNPASQEVTVRHRFNSPLGYQLYSVHGQLVVSGVLQPLEHRLPVANLAPGVYVLRFADRVARFVVQH